MITSNAGAEFSTKTTIIVALARQPPKNAVIRRLLRPLLRGRRAFPDKTQLITQRKYESGFWTPDRTTFRTPRKMELCCLNRLSNASDLGRFVHRAVGLKALICIFAYFQKPVDTIFMTCGFTFLMKC
jgi:hypothetical protein